MALRAKKTASASCHQTKLIAKPTPNNAAAAPLSQVAMRDSWALIDLRAVMHVVVPASTPAKPGARHRGIELTRAALISRPSTDSLTLVRLQSDARWSLLESPVRSRDLRWKPETASLNRRTLIGTIDRASSRAYVRDSRHSGCPTTWPMKQCGPDEHACDAAIAY